MTIRTVLHTAAKTLAPSSTTPELDSELLLSFVLQQPRSWLLTHAHDSLSEKEIAQFTHSVTERATGKPLAYITGEKEFYGRLFHVTPDVLIPRPETELLIDTVLDLDIPPAPRIADIGTGSGCIAITLQKEIPKASILATDISEKALHIAKQNAEQLHAELDCRISNLFSNFPEKEKHSFDVIVSNPPYVPAAEINSNTEYTKALPFEPPNALTPPNGDALSIIHSIIAEAAPWLGLHGALFIEIGYNQAAAVRKIAKQYFPQAHISFEKDLQGIERVVCIQL